jgi:putative two-component system response regulator
VQVRSALVLALTRLVEYRDIESAATSPSMRQYCRMLAEEAARLPAFAGQIDAAFLETLDLGVPLHDVGKVGLPDHILHKPGKLDPDERVLMQTHTLLGAELLQAVAQEHGSALAFLDTATRIARHHHERWDGEGYPDRLAGEDIPLAARVVAVADVYDALRGHRVYKPALPHSTAARLMLGTVGQFDPALLKAFENCHLHFERTFREMTG